VESKSARFFNDFNGFSDETGDSDKSTGYGRSQNRPPSKMSPAKDAMNCASLPT
jgi:hypothetical protein